jgi:hypothetical protein
MDPAEGDPMLVVFRDGSAIVRSSKVVHASSDAAHKAVQRALLPPVFDEGTPRLDPPNAIIEGELRRLRRGTIEYDRAALTRKLPDAAVYDES